MVLFSINVLTAFTNMARCLMKLMLKNRKIGKPEIEMIEIVRKLFANANLLVLLQNDIGDATACNGLRFNRSDGAAN